MSDQSFTSSELEQLESLLERTTNVLTEATLAREVLKAAIRLFYAGPIGTFDEKLQLDLVNSGV